MHTLRLVLIGLVLASTRASAQLSAPPAPRDPGQPAMTFKVEVNYVEIDATVTDAQGGLVRDLSRVDFEILEEGRPQTVTVFTKVDLPVERVDGPLFRAASVEPDVRTNRREFDGRLFVLVLDDLHTEFTRTSRLRAAATEFIQRYLGANDIAAIVHTGGSKGGAQEFTSSRPLLLRAVNQFIGQKLGSGALGRAEDQRMRTAAGLPAGGASDPDDAERGQKARRMLGQLRQIAEYLSGVHGRRKALVLFSEGIDYDVTNSIENRSASEVLNELRGAIGAAGRGNVSFYTIDPRGLLGIDGISAELGGQSTDTMSALVNETRRSQDSLRTLAEETGGVAAVDRNNYRQTFERIVRDNSSYYVLGYYSDNTRRDGRFRKVEVKVRRPGVAVRSRKGYLAPRGDAKPARPAAPASATPELREALTSPVPVSGLTLTASAAAFRSGSKNASILVVVEIDGARFRFVEKGGGLWDEIELVTLPFDASGNPRNGTRDLIAMTPRPQTRDQILAKGIRMTKRLELAPGRYQLRVGAREAGTGQVGSVLLDLEVPDFGKAPLAMSGLALASPGANVMATARPDEQLKDVLPAPPTVTREFLRDDQLSLFTEIYDQIRAAHRVQVTTTATGDDGRIAFQHRDERSSSELRAGGDAFGHVATIPLKGFAPGRYVLRVEALPTASAAGPVFRELEFTVR